MTSTLSRSYPALGVEVVPSMPAHFLPVAERMRPEDAREVLLACGHCPMQALETSFTASVDASGERRAWTLLVQGRPEALFGVGVASLLSSVGLPWMLSTGAATKLAVPFARHCGEYLDAMGRNFSRLENHVHVGNRLSIRWLKWLGFHFDDPAPFGVRQALFRRFWKDV